MSGEFSCNRSKIWIIEPCEAVRLGLDRMLGGPAHGPLTMVWSSVREALRSGADEPAFLILSSALATEELELISDHVVGYAAKKLIILHESDDPAQSMSRYAFADGLIMMGELTSDRLRSTLDRLNDGHIVLPAKLARRIMRLPEQESPLPSGRRSWPVLTPRETQVIELLAEGYSNKQIGPRIGISEHGVKRHVTNVLAKLNCSNRAQAVAYALQNGLVYSELLPLDV